MEKIRGNTLIHNGQPVASRGYNPPVSTGFYYEVVRYGARGFMFIDDHLDRLMQSCRKSREKCPDEALIRASLNQLVEKEPFREGNIKLVYYRSMEEAVVDCYFIPHRYPTHEEYSKGVVLKTFRFTRPDPTVKRWNDQFRSQVNQFIREEQIYEAILLNEEGFLTEGSRSNLFFVDAAETIVTAPTGVVLPGITRKHVLRFCDSEKIPVREQLLRPEQTMNMSACFITGTSPKVLPVRMLDEMNFNVHHPILRKIMKGWLKQ
jgi:branched-chain amino acid aminotransferase